MVHGGRLAVQAKIGRERRLETRPPRFALERFDQPGFLTADVCTCADKGMQVKVDTGTAYILAEQARLVGLFQRSLETRNRLIHKLAANIVVTHRGAHRETTDGHALNQRMRVEAQNVAVVAGTRLTLIRVADGILLHGRILGHEAPLQARRKARAPAAAQPRRLDLVDDLRRGNLAGENFLPGLVATLRPVSRQGPGLGLAEGVETNLVQRVFHGSTPMHPESRPPSQG